MPSIRRKTVFFHAALAAAAIGIFALAFSVWRKDRSGESIPPAAVTLPFRYGFEVEGSLEETDTIAESSSPYWWLNSGGRLRLEGGVGRTLHGALPQNARWRRLYAATDPGATTGGARPQNVFRLLLRDAWRDVSAEAYFKIDAYDLSPDENRSESNGVLLFQRYRDDDNLYYAGVRVDGYAVIKKKIGGIYHTLAYERVFPGAYDRADQPNLLPTGKWLGLKVETRNLDANRVSIKLFAELEKTGAWTPLAEAVDDGLSFGGPAFTQAGHPGIRTDFMDVEFDDFALKAASAEPLSRAL